MGLPCAHVIHERKALGGLHPHDFDVHWFWDQKDPHIPLCEPHQVHTSLNNKQQANTGQILSSFETIQPTQAPPKCSACYQRGHTCTSNNCPIKLKAAIAESSQCLRENGVSQTLQASNISPTSTTVSTPVRRSPFRSYLRPQSTVMGGFQTSLPSTPENYSENAVGHTQASNTLQNPILISSSPIRVPSPAKVSSCVTSLISTEHQLPTFIMPPPVPDGPSLSNIQIPSPPPPPQLLPLKPLGPKHPEMIYMRYIAEKEAWLAQNPQVSSDIDEYQKAQGWPIYHKKVLDEWRKHLGWE